ncbi:type II secretion system protein F [Andreesenia angusta]|uniref:Type II secretion system protein F n=1 Tax=Andreesenia angusta TaxID=39480 RepID=A0A1S1V7V4_9FIRM|nr:type II secretion system F family protein [Andreesenia angusta]OHW62688.1 type II secretion system protein F [Andreesenia angusta]
MPEYKYRALTQDGATQEGLFIAESDSEVLEMIRERSWYPVDIALNSTSSELELDFFNKVKTKDISIFCRQFATMINSGITIINILEITEKQTQNKKLKKAIKEVHSDVQKGATFSEALKQRGEVFPGLLTSMVEAGEASGNLDEIMMRMAVHYEKEYKINNKIKSAMIYPVVLGIVAFAVVVFMLLFVLPNFVSMFESAGAELPLPTRMLLAMSTGLKNYWFIVFPVIFLGIFGLYRYTKTPSGRWVMDRAKLRLPAVKGPVKDIVTSRFTRTLSILFGSGVPLIQALDITSTVIQNVVLESKIQNMKEEIRKGYTLSRSIRDIDEFPPMMKSMIGVGEESGTLDEILDKTANFYDEEVEVAVQRLTALIEPVMIIFMAGIVGFIVIAIALPMFGMYEAIQSTV